MFILVRMLLSMLMITPIMMQFCFSLTCSCSLSLSCFFSRSCSLSLWRPQKVRLFEHVKEVVFVCSGWRKDITSFHIHIVARERQTGSLTRHPTLGEETQHIPSRNVHGVRGLLPRSFRVSTLKIFEKCLHAIDGHLMGTCFLQRLARTPCSTALSLGTVGHGLCLSFLHGARSTDSMRVPTGFAFAHPPAKLGVVFLKTLQRLRLRFNASTVHFFDCGKLSLLFQCCRPGFEEKRMFCPDVVRLKVLKHLQRRLQGIGVKNPQTQMPNVIAVLRMLCQIETRPLQNSSTTRLRLSPSNIFAPSPNEIRTVADLGLELSAGGSCPGHVFSRFGQAVPT
mmetsp:Transcript_9706/g.27025  ORF Transcript_9706/g.27025 Transcript_9706/m.27025 type:complete len:338 (+) Transcript_9706:2-1015(+)